MISAYSLAAELRRARDHYESVQRAVIHVQSSGREGITGANVLVAMFAETQSPAVRLLGEQDMTRQGAVNFIVHGTAKPS
jgi:ATP-dependent Clp protease ATP-binding subunit ClpA